MKTSLFGIILIICLLFPSAYFHYLHLQQKIAQAEAAELIEKGLDREVLTVFTFNPVEYKKLNWKHYKEFAYNGQMYDIISQKKINGAHIIWCWHDTKETRINHVIKKMLAQYHGHTNSTKKTKSTAKHLIQLYFSNTHYLSLFLPENIVTPDHYMFSIILFNQSPASPPPIWC